MLGAGQSTFLSQVRRGSYAVASRVDFGARAARFNGSIAEYAKLHTESRGNLCSTSLFNHVKVCPTCSKPNGFTLAACNRCKSDLSGAPLTQTPNLFTGFLLGIRDEPRFPLTLSMRMQNEDVLVFDDPLALSPLHFCGVPSGTIIPDWRYLLLRPRDGLAVCRMVVDACHEAARSQFLSDTRWCRSLLAPGTFALDDMIVGYNFPPSQGQLHVQYMMPLFMPHQYMMFLRGVHFTHSRFFPIDFVEGCLQRLIDAGSHFTLADIDVPIQRLLELLRSRCGMDYDITHRRLMERADERHRHYANWRPEHFEGTCTVPEDADGTVVFERCSDGTRVHLPEHEVYELEKKALQNYATSSNPAEAPVGYYAFSRDIGALRTDFLCSD